MAWMESATGQKAVELRLRRGTELSRNSLQMAGASAVSRQEAGRGGRCGMSVELALEGVGLNYRQGAHTTVALEDVTLSVEHEEFVTIVGASGCGKSSLLNLVAGSWYVNLWAPASSIKCTSLHRQPYRRDVGASNRTGLLSHIIQLVKK